MSEFEKIAKVDEIPEGEGRSYVVGDRVVAIFNVDGKFYAIDDACPHMGASLSTGHMEECVVFCPLHAWRFSVKDGTWCDNPRVATDYFELKREGDDLLINPEPKNKRDEI